MARWLLLLVGTLIIPPLFADYAWSQATGNTPATAAITASPPPNRDEKSRPPDARPEAKPPKRPLEAASADPSKKPPKRPRGVSARRQASGEHRTLLSMGPLQAGEQAILKALDEPASFEFNNEPLTALVDQIRQKHHIPVMVDKKALDEVGIGSDASLTAAIPQVPLHNAIDLALQDLNLSWIVRSGALLITTPEVEESYLIDRCYDIADLLAVAPDRPYKSGLPNCPAPNQAECPVFQGSMGAAAQQGGTGAMSSRTMLPATRESSGNIDAVIDMITSTVQPHTWDSAGGPGTISFFDNLMVVHQTLRIHREIDALLAEIRARRAAVGTLVVELHWLWLDAAQHEDLLIKLKPAKAEYASLVVDANALAQLARKVPGFHGQIACSNGQLVRLASGDRRSVISSAIPVIGSGVGYQPVIEVPNEGVVLELRANAVHGAEAAVLDVQSAITRWGRQRPTARVGASWPPFQSTESLNDVGKTVHETTMEPGGSASAPIDQPNMPAQELATTVRVPLGRPVILGAMTFSPAGAAGLAEATANPKQLYLIATTRMAKPAVEQDSRKP
jgi:hypothetical protein